jgi:hypothetical protein
MRAVPIADIQFLPELWSDLTLALGAYPGLTVVIGAFADRQFPPPKVSVFEEECHDCWAPPATLDIERTDRVLRAIGFT